MRRRLAIRGGLISPPGTVPLPFVLDSQHGMSLIELLVAIGILGLLVALALPRLNSSQLELSTTTQDLVGNLRIARANATGRGAHYRATFSSDSYSIQRLQDDNDDGGMGARGSFPTSGFAGRGFSRRPRWGRRGGV